MTTHYVCSCDAQSPPASCMVSKVDSKEDSENQIESDVRIEQMKRDREVAELHS